MRSISQLHAQLSVTMPGLPSCNVSMNQTPVSLSLASPSPKHTDDRLDWNTPRLGIAHRRLDRTGGGLLQGAAPHSSDMATVTEVETASSCHGVCHRKGRAPPEEQGIDRH